MIAQRRSVGLVIFVLIVGLLLSVAVQARPGGGSSYSGGGGGGGGSSSSGGSDWGSGGASTLDGADLVALVELFIEYPKIGTTIVLILAGLMVLNFQVSVQPSDWEYGEFHRGFDPANLTSIYTVERSYDSVRDSDPAFSAVLFEDFVYALYSAAHRARHDRERLAELAPYLSEGVRNHLRSRRYLLPIEQDSTGRGEVGVTAAVIGAMKVVRVWQSDEQQPLAKAADQDPNSPGHDWIRIQFESNLVSSRLDSEEGAMGQENGPAPVTEYVLERWLFKRERGRQTQAWLGVRTFQCPSCAGGTSYSSNVCNSCGEEVAPGRFDWAAVGCELVSREVRPPSLLGTVEEVGTEEPTVFQPGVKKRWEIMAAADPSLTGGQFAARLRHIFDELNRGWNEQDERLYRAVLSDGQFSSMNYWLEAYAAQGLRNYNERARLDRFVVAKVSRDLHFDAVTVRVWGSGLDYTVDGEGGVVAGSRTRPRRYSEYWTLIRSAGVQGRPDSDHHCPSCGAELSVGMTGECDYCQTNVTRGDFDWVLSKIEQDDSYS